MLTGEGTSLSHRSTSEIIRSVSTHEAQISGYNTGSKGFLSVLIEFNIVIGAFRCRVGPRRAPESKIWLIYINVDQFTRTPIDSFPVGKGAQHQGVDILVEHIYKHAFSFAVRHPDLNVNRRNC
jgi:hypothetical protein